MLRCRLFRLITTTIIMGGWVVPMVVGLEGMRVGMRRILVIMVIREMVVGGLMGEEGEMEEGLGMVVAAEELMGEEAVEEEEMEGEVVVAERIERLGEAMITWEQ